MKATRQINTPIVLDTKALKEAKRAQPDLARELTVLLRKWSASQEDEIFGQHMTSGELAAYLIARISGGGSK